MQTMRAISNTRKTRRKQTHPKNRTNASHHQIHENKRTDTSHNQTQPKQIVHVNQESGHMKCKVVTQNNETAPRSARNSSSLTWDIRKSLTVSSHLVSAPVSQQPTRSAIAEGCVQVPSSSSVGYVLNRLSLLKIIPARASGVQNRQAYCSSLSQANNNAGAPLLRSKYKLLHATISLYATQKFGHQIRRTSFHHCALFSDQAWDSQVGQPPNV